MEPCAPSSEAVRAQLARILAAPGFKNAPRLGEFLAFVVTEALSGRSAQIKEYSIGTAVYRKPAMYDPRLDATVRVEAAKLRSRLHQYYQGAGEEVRVYISIPKGSYVPKFATIGQPELQPLHALASIAVLPFLNLSSDPNNDYFADGLVEELTSALTRTNRMRVASRTSAFRFRGDGADIRDIGRALNVERLLEGTVRKSGDLLRITVQLVEVVDLSQLWSQTYDRTLADIFGVQEEIAAAVVSLLCGGDASQARRPILPRHTASAAAFELYLHGRHRVDQWNVKSVQEAVRYFEEAIELDPEYPLPYAGLAKAADCLATMGVVPPVDVLPKAKASLERALALDPELAEARISRATWIARHEWDWAAAERDF